MTTNARGRRTIAAIEAAALDAADEIGFERATVREICVRAGVAERVFFNHFATREDAFLGSDQPAMDGAWARDLVADPMAALVDGAMRLVRMPQVDPETRARRHALIAQHPPLLARAHALLSPLREQCLTVVAAAAAQRFPELPEAQIARLSRVIVAMAGELLDVCSPAELGGVLDAVRTAIPRGAIDPRSVRTADPPTVPHASPPTR